MSLSKAGTILGIWAMALIAFLRYVDYVERHSLGPGYFRMPVVLLILGAIATVYLIEDD